MYFTVPIFSRAHQAAEGGERACNSNIVRAPGIVVRIRVVNVTIFSTRWVWLCTLASTRDILLVTYPLLDAPLILLNYYHIAGNVRGVKLSQISRIIDKPRKCGRIVPSRNNTGHTPLTMYVRTFMHGGAWYYLTSSLAKNRLSKYPDFSGISPIWFASSRFPMLTQAA